MKVRVLLFICSCLAWNACAQPSPCGTFDYDALGQQIRIRSSGSSPSGTFSLDLLMQFQQKVVYEIDYLERTCKKVPLDAPFNPIQIPPGSFPVAQTVLGTSSVAGMGLLANTWYGEIPEIQGKPC
ncbi:hypothetical protein SRHO_G00056990 [Serrasalmus rhombeus]